MKKKSVRSKGNSKNNSGSKGKPQKSAPAKYPRHAVSKSLRIPQAILEQNAGKPCSVKESATFLGVGAAGPYQVEVSSGIKYGFLERPEAGQISVTELAKKALRPKSPQDKLEAIREAVLQAPIVSDV
ncbi:hypothetical protein [Gimesia panareensis]|uniref:hypothetical protein n=1 Tax=Gimesia panareensis TaxID=2527978 RepID=UPI0018D61663|nr:hypothetical protein [Gimesia panareensis]